MWRANNYCMYVICTKHGAKIDNIKERRKNRKIFIYGRVEYHYLVLEV